MLKYYQEVAEKLLSKPYFIGYGVNKSIILKTNGWTFEYLKSRSVRRLGLCNPNTKTIGISEKLVKLNPDRRDVWLDTIKHEIAHAIDFEIRGRSDHSIIWKRIAKQVGAMPETFFSQKLITKT